jgi:hypothetical protein
MGVEGQFQHPLVLRAKLEIAAACHAAGKVPSHCVVTEFKDSDALQQAAEKACRQLGYTRMWSIHPTRSAHRRRLLPHGRRDRPGRDILLAAQAADWAPIRHRHLGRDQLHDRASYRYFWQVLQRAHRTSFSQDPSCRPRCASAFSPKAGRMKPKVTKNQALRRTISSVFYPPVSRGVIRMIRAFLTVALSLGLLGAQAAHAVQPAKAKTSKSAKKAAARPEPELALPDADGPQTPPPPWSASATTTASSARRSTWR